MNLLGLPMKIWGSNENLVVSNENLGVFNLGFPTKSLGFPTKIRGLKAEMADLGKWAVFKRQKPPISRNGRFLKGRNRPLTPKWAVSRARECFRTPTDI